MTFDPAPFGSWQAHLAYALAWAAFGVLHSLLADARVKARLAPVLAGGYRLAYNVMAILTLALVLWVGWESLGRLGPFDLPGPLLLAMRIAHVSGWAVLLVALGGYDGARFLGLRQLREGRDDTVLPPEPLKTGGLNAYVRHPVYAGGFLILWGVATNPLFLATALWASAYLVIGAKCEERRLLALYGEDYRRYREAVPAFVPWKGRVRLSRR